MFPGSSSTVGRCTRRTVWSSEVTWKHSDTHRNIQVEAECSSGWCFLLSLNVRSPPRNLCVVKQIQLHKWFFNTPTLSPSSSPLSAWKSSTHSAVLALCEVGELLSIGSSAKEPLLSSPSRLGCYLCFTETSGRWGDVKRITVWRSGGGAGKNGKRQNKQCRGGGGVQILCSDSLHLMLQAKLEENVTGQYTKKAADVRDEKQR